MAVYVIEEGGLYLAEWSHSTWGQLLQTTSQWQSWYQWTLLQLQYAQLRLWGCWLWMQGWIYPVFEWSITRTWAAEEVSSIAIECVSNTTPVFQSRYFLAKLDSYWYLAEISCRTNHSKHICFLRQESLANANVKRATAVHVRRHMTSIGTTVAKLWPFLYVQDGRQPPSWILSNRK